VRSVSLPEGPDPEIIGQDDWAWRNGHRYGTIIVDREQGCPIDVLENRAAETVATWLHSHPDVTVVARDRAEASVAGIRQRAPEATQVADRFHLLKNVAAALQEVFSAHHRELDQLHHMPHNEPPTQDADAVMVPPEPPVTMTTAQQQIAHNRAKRVADYAQARALHKQGWTMQALSTHLGRPHRPIKKSLEASPFPARPPRRQPPSILDPYKAYLLKRWQAGDRSAKELYHERQAPGLRVSTGSWRPLSAACVRRKDGSPDAESRDRQRRALQWTSR
jgi:hypothetical protein